MRTIGEIVDGKPTKTGTVGEYAVYLAGRFNITCVISVEMTNEIF